jgi:hypothetical protein
MRPRTEAGSRLYLACTPYHLLMCLAIQVRDGCPPATLLYADEAGLLEEYPKVLGALEEWFSVQVIQRLGPVPVWRQPIAYRLAGRAARRALRAAREPERVFVCNGQRPEVYGIRRALRGRLPVDHVEDGLDAYIPCNTRPFPVWRARLHRWVFAEFWPTEMTAVLPFARQHVLSPEFARHGSETVATAIPGQCLSVAVRILSAPVGSGAGEEPERVTHLRLLHLSNRISDVPEYFQELRAWAKFVRSTENAVPAIKAHPREINAEVLDLLKTVDAFVFPNRVPIELVGLRLAPDVVVTCGLTTFIVSSRFLLPRRRIILDKSVNPLFVSSLRDWDASILSDPPTSELVGAESAKQDRRAGAAEQISGGTFQSDP